MILQPKKYLVIIALSFFNVFSPSLVLPTLSYFVVLFCRLRALSTKYNSLPQAASRPFDCGRDGFVYVISLLNYVPLFHFPMLVHVLILCSEISNRIGEGCGVMVLEVSFRRKTWSRPFCFEFVGSVLFPKIGHLHVGMIHNTLFKSLACHLARLNLEYLNQRHIAPCGLVFALSFAW